MGVVHVALNGSFDQLRAIDGLPLPQLAAGRFFGATEHGHARAVADAIVWLSEVVLPAAIRLDHDLHDEGETPRQAFGQYHPSDGGS